MYQTQRLRQLLVIMPNFNRFKKITNLMIFIILLDKTWTMALKYQIFILQTIIICSFQNTQ
jgi:hypothetical protein